MSDETPATEPTIPVIAAVPAVPLASLQDLFATAARDWPQASQPGVLVGVQGTERGVSLAVTLAIQDWQGAVLGTRTYDGHWEISGLVRWSPRQ